MVRAGPKSVMKQQLCFVKKLQFQKRDLYATITLAVL